MAKIKIKTKVKNHHIKNQLLEILASNDVFATNVFETRDGYSVTLLRQEEQEVIFAAECQAALTSKGFSTVTPPDLKSKRTILMFNCPEEVTRHEANDIKEEIHRVNPFTINLIEEVSKFHGKPIIKIIFKQINAARKAQEAGIRLYNMSIPPHQIEEEEYFPITMCMRCYSLDSHYTNQCKKNKEYQVCSECGDQGHKWFACTSENKTCLNCGGNHRTLAYKCPARKTIMKNKKEEKKAKKDITYSQITATNTNTVTTQPIPTSSINSDSSNKIMTCILLAHGINIEHPNSFEDALNTHLEANDLPKVNVPIIPNSRVIFNLPPLTLPNNTDNTNITSIIQEQTSQTPSRISQTTPNTTNNDSSTQEDVEEEDEEIEIENNQDEQEQETENQDEEQEEEHETEDQEEEQDEEHNTDKETVKKDEQRAERKHTSNASTKNSFPSPTPTDNSTTSTRTPPSTTSSPTSDTGNTPTKTQNTNTTPANRRTRRTQKGKWRN